MWVLLKNKFFLTGLISIIGLQLFAQRGEVLELDGTSGYMVINNHADLSVGLGESKTFTMWINTTSTTASRLFTRRNGSAIGFELVLSGTGKLAVNARSTTNTNSGTAYTDIAVNDGVWHHIAVVFNQSNASKFIEIYVDGTSVITSTNPYTEARDFTHSNDFVIGATNAFAAKYKGQLDDFRVFGYALSTAQVQNDMITKSSELSDANLLAAWDFENITDNTVPDISNNDHNGTLYGSSETTVYTHRFNTEITTYKNTDAVNQPLANQILFLGSSSFARWTDVQSYFPDKPIINRGFGGSTILDVIYFLKEIAFQYSPKQIVIYCGENDMASSGVTAEIGTNRFKVLYSLLRQHYGNNINITYVSVKPSPARVAAQNKYQEANNNIKAFLETEANTEYVDVFSKMLDGNNEPIASLFGSDNLHMNASGYATWKTEIEPALLASNYSILHTGKYLDLDGVDDYMLVPTHPSLNIDAGESYTITAKIKTNTFRNAPLIRKRDGTSVGYEMVTGSNGAFAINIRSAENNNAGPATSTARMTTGNWHHVAMVVNTADQTSKIYVNGVLDQINTTAVIGTESFANLFDLYIGRSVSQNRYFLGQMDDIRFWGKAMSLAEIQADMSSVVNGPLPNLLAAYDFEDAQGGYVPDISGNEHHGVLYGKSSGVTFSKIPQNMQFYARDSQNLSTIEIAGKLTTSNIDFIKVEFYKDNAHQTTVEQQLVYNNGEAPFNLSEKISAVLAQYKIIVKTKDVNGNEEVVAVRDRILSGDAFVIMGQSNSHPTRPGESYTNPFLRSFGIQTTNTNYATYNPADTLWGYANADQIKNINYFSGAYSVGVWGLVMADSLMKKLQVPICIINGGAGSSNIEENLPLANHLDLTSVYGRMLYRVEKAGLKNNIKALIWHQGEKNADASYSNYATNFNTLYEAWKTDLPNLSRVYVFQTNLNGCYNISTSVNQSKLREFQRSLPQIYPDVKVFASAGVPGMEEGDGNEITWCHYGLEGYRIMGKRFYYFVASDLYGVAFNTNPSSPNIVRAYYANAEKTQVTLEFDNHNLVWPSSLNGYDLKDYFYFDETQYGNIASVSVLHNTVTFNLINTSTATTISYLPNRSYNGTSTVYVGPYLTNEMQVGALTFNNFPINEYEATLPLQWLTITAKKNIEKAIIEWEVSDEKNVKNYIVERGNGFDWQAIGTVAFKQSANNINRYAFSDIKPLFGINYYKVKQNDTDGKFSYSAIKTVDFSVGNNPFEIYPVPFNNAIYLSVPKNLSAQYLKVSIVGIDGKLVRKSEFKISSATEKIVLDNLGFLNNGVYLVKVINEKEEMLFNQKIIK